MQWGRRHAAALIVMALKIERHGVEANQLQGLSIAALGAAGDRRRCCNGLNIDG
jgi:hypothetical protein